VAIESTRIECVAACASPETATLMCESLEVAVISCVADGISRDCAKVPRVDIDAEMESMADFWSESVDCSLVYWLSLAFAAFTRLVMIDVVSSPLTSPENETVPLDDDEEELDDETVAMISLHWFVSINPGAA
jgi:hypothetical protein